MQYGVLDGILRWDRGATRHCGPHCSYTQYERGCRSANAGISPVEYSLGRYEAMIYLMSFAPEVFLPDSVADILSRTYVA